MQDFLALSIVAVTAVYLGRSVWLRFTRKHIAGCGTCGGCASEQKPLVQIQVSHAEAQRTLRR